MEKVIIRDATPDDALAIAQVHVRTWQCAYRGLMPDALLDGLSIEKRTTTWQEQLSNPEAGSQQLVAELNGKIIGWCTVGKNSDEDMSSETGELYGIYIDPDYIGQGVGSQLMEVALNRLQKDGYEKATLWVLHSNIKTKKFYEKKGWKKEGRTKEYIREGFESHIIRYICSLHKHKL